MKPDWDSLAKKYADSEYVLVGDVDCTSDTGKDICGTYGVEGYPTLKYFPPGDKTGKSYEGGRSKKDLVKFVKKYDPGFVCTAATVAQCSEKQLTKLQPYLDMAPAELEALRDSLQAEIGAAKATRDAAAAKLEEFRKKPFGPASAAEGKALREELEAADAPFKEVKKAKSATLKLVANALKTEAPKASTNKDEV